MKQQRFTIQLLAAFALFIFLHSCSPSGNSPTVDIDKIQQGFANPTDSNTVWCYWYWINDDISKAGVTKDLEAMKKAGIGGALIGNINPAKKDGKVPLFSDLWWETMVHAVTEGKRIGVDIGIFNCPGWSQSGGPWVKSDMAMRYLTYSETQVKGPGAIKLQLEQPKDDFQDVRTLAFKSPEAERTNLVSQGVKIKSIPEIANLKLAFDGNVETAVEFDARRNTEITIDIQLDNEITARQIKMQQADAAFKCNCELYATIDGEDKLLRKFEFDRSKATVNVGPITKGELALSLPNVKAKSFKLVLNNFLKKGPYGFSEIAISEAAVLENYIEKQLGKMHPTPTPTWDTYSWDLQDTAVAKTLMIDSKHVIDISDKVDENGLLQWDAGEGDWTIMRIGMTPTGTKNSPAAPQGQGFEIDKMSSKLAKVHFDNFVGEFLKRIPEDSKSAFKYVIGDSYEMGSQNWTDGYELKFKEKYGYDPIPFLPVLSGRIVGSVEESERFLWDLRRTVADDVAYEYVGGLKKASNEKNLQVWLENYGHWGFPSEFLMYGGQSDLVSGEFWNEGTLGNIECKASSSSAHIYGKNRVSAESFTAGRKTYLRHPALLKKRGDWSYTEGINHTVLHLYIQQPDDNRVPGMNAWFSTEFNRHNTWFGQANNYFDYLRRCQHLLQQGKYVADVCYFIGENAPIMTGGRVPELPEGYSYDYINAEVIINSLTVKDGRFVLPDGMEYKVMVLAPYKTMRPELLAKLEQLVNEGGVILGQQPEKSPSMQNYPACDTKVQELANKMWSSKYNNGKMNQQYGKGKVFDGYQLTELFDTLNIAKDVDLQGADSVLWTHRSMPGADIYFISNQSEKAINIEPIFRVTDDKKPQLWDALTGEVRSLADFSKKPTGTAVPLKLEARQSWFIVFANAEPKEMKKAYATNFPHRTVFKTIDSPYTVEFQNKAIAPDKALVYNELTDWSKSDDEQIKYYSGTAIYKAKFNIDALPKDKDIFLNLGNVAVMAQAKLNGKDIGGVWIAPYLLNINEALQEGENEIEIEVANLWRNRLIKDKSLPEDERYTWIVEEDIKEGEELQPSGLLSPVTIEVIDK